MTMYLFSLIRIADWFMQVYGSLRGHEKLNDGIVRAFDSLMEENPELAERYRQQEDGTISDVAQKQSNREAAIRKYTDKSRYKAENIHGSVYVDAARVKLSEKNDYEKEKFDEELKAAERFSKKYGYEVFMLPPEEGGNVIYAEKNSNPDAVIQGVFIDFNRQKEQTPL